MAPRGRTLTVYLAADSSKATREMEGFAGKMKSLVGPALMGAAAAAGAFAVKLGVDAVQGAIAEQAEIAKLNALLEKNGFASAAGDVDTFISKQAALTTFTDSELRPAFERLFLATGDVKTAQDLLVTSMDTAIGAGKNLETTTSAIAKAVDGNTGSLKKLIPGLDDATIKTEGLDALTSQLSDRFEGQATTAAETWEGQLGNVTDAFGELKDSFGAGFLEGLGSAEGGVGDLTQAMLDMQGPIKEIGRLVGEDLAVLGTFLQNVVDIKNAMDDWRKSMDGTVWGKVFDAFAKAVNIMANPLYNLLALINDVIAKIKELLSMPSMPDWMPGGATRSASLASGGTARSAGQTVNVTVQAGIGNPIEIARTIEGVLAAKQSRLGIA